MNGGLKQRCLRAAPGCKPATRQLRVRAQIHVDVAVVGGGPAGLAAAAALQVATSGSKEIHVFEKTSMKARGAAILVGANGLKALHAISPSLLDTMVANATKLEAADRFSYVTGEHIETQKMPNDDVKAKYGFNAALLGWSDITTALKSALPEGTLHPSCPITSYRVLPDNTIQLLGPRPLGDTASTSSSDPSCSSGTSNNEEHVVATCNLLVGADGWFSPIRQQLLGDGPPMFQDCVVWRARIKRPEDFPEDRTRWWIPPTGARAGDVLAVLIPLPGGDLVWQCHAPVRVLAEKGLSFDPVKGEAGSSHASNNTASTGGGSSSNDSEQTPKERCLQAFAGFPAPFLDMVKATPAAAITEHGLYQRTPEQIPDGSWGVGSVTLAGDAAHAAYVDGTGLALSLEDAAVLGWHVQQLGLTPAALRAYEAERIPRVKAIFELAARQAAAPRGSQNPEAWAERAELLYGGANFQPLGPGAAVGQQAAAMAPKEPVAASM